jgi:hypothetical protein
MSLQRMQSGFTHLVNGVRAYFADQEIGAVVAYGLKAWWRQDNQGPGGASRVVFILGEFHGEKELRSRAYGRIHSPFAHNTQNFIGTAGGFVPRELAGWTRPAAVAVWAAPDLIAPSDELLQNEQTEILLEQVLAAVRTAQMADCFVKGWDVERITPPLERGFGEALCCNFELRGPLFYPATDTATPSAAVSRGTVS